ncbi:MAG: MarR family transcriptional regulator [Rubrobacter sp.]|nr:MarR family transcriptional regulator [Rubrobacter sp.]
MDEKVYLDAGGKLDGKREAAWRALISTNALVIDKIERELSAAELPPLGWYDVLLELSRASDRRLRMHELAQAVVLSRSGLTRLVDRLERAGLLRREPTPEDRRGAFAVLTDDGRDTLDQMWPVYAKGIAEHFGGHLSDGDADAISDALSRVMAAELDR